MSKIQLELEIQMPEHRKNLIFLNTHLGYPLNFIFAFHGHVKGAYLCLAEVKWVKTGAPGVKPMLGAPLLGSNSDIL